MSADEITTGSGGIVLEDSVAPKEAMSLSEAVQPTLPEVVQVAAPVEQVQPAPVVVEEARPEPEPEPEPEPKTNAEKMARELEMIQAERGRLKDLTDRHLAREACAD